MEKINKINRLWREYYRFGLEIAILQIFSEIIKYWIYSGKSERFGYPKKLFTKIISRKDMKVQKWLLKEYQPLLNEIANEQSHEKVVNKIIWTMWFQGIDDMPQTVNLCHHSVERYKGNYQHITLTQDNLEEYIVIPNLIMEKWKQGIISNANFSDYVRVSVLDKYGGIWLDATVLLSSNFPSEIENYAQFHAKGINRFKYDFLYFQSQNWESYFLAKLGNSNIYYFLKKAFELYWQDNNKEIDYLLLHHLAFIARTYSKKFKDEYNKIPFNNIDVEAMYPLLTNKVKDNDKYQNIISGDTILFKLNHRHSFETSLDGEKTVYGQLKDEFTDIREKK